MMPSHSKAVSETTSRERVRKLFGLVPALFDETTHNLAVANAYLSALEALERGTLMDGERHVVMLAVSAANGSANCVDLHRGLALAADVQTADLDLITARRLPIDRRLHALTQATWQLIDQRGRLDRSDLQQLDRQGVEHRQLYEIIATIGVKTMSNYIEHLSDIKNHVSRDIN